MYSLSGSENVVLKQFLQLRIFFSSVVGMADRVLKLLEFLSADHSLE